MSHPLYIQGGAFCNKTTTLTALYPQEMTLGGYLYAIIVAPLTGVASKIISNIILRKPLLWSVSEFEFKPLTRLLARAGVLLWPHRKQKTDLLK